MARSLSSFDASLSTVPARGTTCPCGSTELDGARLDHDGRAECCESYCNPDTCECASDSAPSSDECHAAWVRLGMQGPIALLDRLVATMTAAGVSQYAAEDAAVAVYDAGGVGTLAYAVERAEAKTIVTTQRIYPITDETMAMFDAVETAVTCGCGRSHTRAGFLALSAPVAGDTMDDGDGGVLILRNCPCGSTRAVQATAEETLRACPEFSAHVDGWKAEAIAHQELFGIFEELADAVTAEAANDDWEAEARSGYLADLGLAGSMR